MINDNKCINFCGIQPTGAVTMAMEVLHKTCSMYIHDLPDMNALIPQAGHTYQAYPSSLCSNYCICVTKG